MISIMAKTAHGKSKNPPQSILRGSRISTRWSSRTPLSHQAFDAAPYSPPLGIIITVAKSSSSSSSSRYPIYLPPGHAFDSLPRHTSTLVFQICSQQYLLPVQYRKKLRFWVRFLTQTLGSEFPAAPSKPARVFKNRIHRSRSPATRTRDIWTMPARKTARMYYYLQSQIRCRNSIHRNPIETQKQLLQTPAMTIRNRKYYLNLLQ